MLQNADKALRVDPFHTKSSENWFEIFVSINYLMEIVCFQYSSMTNLKALVVRVNELRAGRALVYNELRKIC